MKICVPNNKLLYENELMGLIREYIYELNDSTSQLLKNLLYVVNKSIIYRVGSIFFHDVIQNDKSKILKRVKKYDDILVNNFISPTLIYDKYRKNILEILNEPNKEVEIMNKNHELKQPIILNDLSVLGISISMFNKNSSFVKDNTEYIQLYILPLLNDKIDIHKTIRNLLIKIIG